MGQFLVYLQKLMKMCDMLCVLILRMYVLCSRLPYIGRPFQNRLNTIIILLRHAYRAHEMFVL